MPTGHWSLALVYSVPIIQFPAQTGFTLRYNLVSGISAALRPAKLFRVGFQYPSRAASTIVLKFSSGVLKGIGLAQK